MRAVTWCSIDKSEHPAWVSQLGPRVKNVCDKKDFCTDSQVRIEANF